MENPVIAEVAALAARHKLVPFLGAGCSIPHLSYSWDAITAGMAGELGTLETDPLVIAQAYEDRFGRAAFIRFLEQRLLVDTYDDMKGLTHLQVLSLRVGVIYTTNQDNVMEHCIAKYARRYKVVTTIDDLAEALPDQPLYIKYHGDLAEPTSVVFTTQDFASRVGSDHFLNIKLKADLLTKRLLFIGFSFRDPNIRGTFDELKTVFGGCLPASYLLAWEGSPELAAICAEYGIVPIIPREIHPEAKSIAEAFTLTLTDIIGETVHHKRQTELDELFRPSVPSSMPVVTSFEIAAVKKAVKEESFDEAINTFRGYFDVSIVPEAFEEEVAGIFLELARKCASTDDAEALNTATLHWHIATPGPRLKVLAAIIAALNARDKNDHSRVFCPALHGIPDNWMLGGIVAALQLLHDWGRPVSDGIRYQVSSLLERHECDVTTYPPEIQAAARHWLERAWFDRSWAPYTVLEHPLKRYERLKQGGHLTFLRQGHRSVATDLMASMPKGFLKPYEA